MGSSSKRKREEEEKVEEGVEDEEEEEEESEDDEGSFQVEVITRARVQNADWEYKVSWAGYGKDDDTWEPGVNLAACQALLARFWKHVGLDNDDYEEGFVVKATSEWIARERKRFKAEFGKEKDERRKQQERADRRKEQKLAAGSSAENQPKKANTSRSTSTSSHSKGPPNKKAKVVSDDSEDDIPLASAKKSKTKPKASAKTNEPVASSSKGSTPPPTSAGQAAARSLFTPSPPPAKAAANKKTLPIPSRPKSAILAHASSKPSSFAQTSTSRPASTKSTPMIPPQPLSKQPSNVPVKPGSSKLPAAAPSFAQGGSRTMSTDNTPNISRLSTKSRLSMYALQPTAPKDVGKVPMSQLPRIKRKVALATPEAGSPAVPSPSVPPVPPRPPPPPRAPAQDPFLNTPEVQPSPAQQSDFPSMPVDESSILPPNFSRKLTLQNWRATHPPPAAPPPAAPAPAPAPRPFGSFEAEANELLRSLESLHPSFMDSSMPDAPATSTFTEPTPEISLSSTPAPAAPVLDPRKVIPSGRIPKKWTWTGHLEANIGGKVETVSNIYITDPTPVPANAPDLDIQKLMAGQESVHLETFHELLDLHQFLRPFGNVHWIKPQVARVTGSSEKDTEPLRTMAGYMSLKKFVCLVPLFDNESLVAHLLVFPPRARALCGILKVPETSQYTTAPLLAAVVPWIHIADWRPSLGRLPVEKVSRHVPGNDWKRQTLNRQHITSLQIHKLHPDFSDLMLRERRKYTLWTLANAASGSSTRIDRRDTDTVQLVGILAKMRARRVRKDFRVVLVHVGALRKIRRMPFVAEIRQKCASTCFYTYGCHPTVDPSEWGMRELFPCGGIVTFTPSMLYEDPWGAVDKIKEIHAHPLWMCYILPSVLGMATRLCCPSEDPLASFDTGVFIFERLLKSIEDGEVALLTAPPQAVITRKSDSREEWLRAYSTAGPESQREILERGLNVFHAKYTNIPQEEWTGAIEAEIAADLDAMQQQVAIRENYRRFVVVRAQGDLHQVAPKDKEGFEWVAANSPLFGDGYTKA
ncbi:Chromo domain-containing protein [Mycena kentingensis (nom. inval.)]|nr:Chromo domain-containing protein [Mycena kentingensis (nom. inval.)]